MTVKEFCDKYQLKVEVLSRTASLVNDDGIDWPHYRFELQISSVTGFPSGRDGSVYNHGSIAQVYKCGLGLFPKMTRKDFGMNSRFPRYVDPIFTTLERKPNAKFLHDEDNQTYQLMLEEYSKNKKLAPSVDSVLDCVHYSVQAFMGRERFDEFCCNLGYDTDSIKAKKTYDDVMEEGHRWVDFLGVVAAKELVDCEYS